MPPDYIVPFLDVGAINARYISKLSDDAKSVILSGWYVLGQNVLQFETKFAEYCGVKYCSGVASGLDALTISLSVLGITHGDEVIVPANTFIATWLAISEVGARPVPVDCDIETGLIDVSQIEEKIGDPSQESCQRICKVTRIG